MPIETTINRRAALGLGAAAPSHYRFPVS
jgi:hypothetical protein